MASSGNKLSQISALVNLFGGLWCGDSFFDGEENKQFKDNQKKEQSPEADRLTALWKVRCVTGLHPQIAVILGEASVPRFNLTKGSY